MWLEETDAYTLGPVTSGMYLKPPPEVVEWSDSNAPVLLGGYLHLGFSWLDSYDPISPGCMAKCKHPLWSQCVRLNLAFTWVFPYDRYKWGLVCKCCLTQTWFSALRMHRLWLGGLQFEQQQFYGTTGLLCSSLRTGMSLIEHFNFIWTPCRQLMQYIVKHDWRNFTVAANVISTVSNRESKQWRTRCNFWDTLRGNLTLIVPAKFLICWTVQTKKRKQKKYEQKILFCCLFSCPSRLILHCYGMTITTTCHKASLSIPAALSNSTLKYIVHKTGMQWQKYKEIKTALRSHISCYIIAAG